MYNDFMPKSVIAVEIAGTFLATALALAFAGSSLAKYDLQLVAVLFIVYVLLKRLMMRSAGFFVLEAFIFIFIIVSTVFSSGGLQSPFFFLLYFLMFALALFFDSVTTLALTLTLLIYVIATADYSMQLRDLLPALSLPFIAPFAKYLGDLQRKSYRQSLEIKRLSRAKEKGEETMRYDQEQTLIFLTTVLYRHLDEMKERLDNFLGDEDLAYLRKKVKHLEGISEGFRRYVEKI